MPQGFVGSQLSGTRRTTTQPARSMTAATYLTLAVFVGIIAVLLLGTADHLVRRAHRPAAWVVMNVTWMPLYSWYYYTVSSSGRFMALWDASVLTISNLLFAGSGVAIAIATWGSLKRSISLGLIGLSALMLVAVFFLQAHFPDYRWLLPLPGALAMHFLTWRLCLSQRGSKRWRASALLYAPMLGLRTFLPHEFHALIIYLLCLLALKIALWFMLVERDGSGTKQIAGPGPGAMVPTAAPRHRRDPLRPRSPRS